MRTMLLHRTGARCLHVGAIVSLSTASPESTWAQSAPITPVATVSDTTIVADSVAGQRDGTALANKGYGWFGRAFVVGSLTNVYGVLVIVPIAALSTPTVPLDEREKIMSKPVAYQKAFEKSYTRKARAKRILTTLGGSLLGAVTIGYLIMTSGNG
jgi:hypothetical protein